jgi:hypothetical protein
LKPEQGSGHEVCGDPIQRFTDEVAEGRRLGCTIQFTTPNPHTTRMTADCPARPGGRQGRAEVTVVAPTPNAFTIDVRSMEGEREFASFTRVGGC